MVIARAKTTETGEVKINVRTEPGEHYNPLSETLVLASELIKIAATQTGPNKNNSEYDSLYNDRVDHILENIAQRLKIKN